MAEPLKLTIKKPLKLALKEEPKTKGNEPVAVAEEISLPTSDGIRIILKNARIYADKVIIKKIEK